MCSSTEYAQQTANWRLLRFSTLCKTLNLVDSNLSHSLMSIEHGVEKQPSVSGNAVRNYL